jgi:hypothetical protein
LSYVALSHIQPPVQTESKGMISRSLTNDIFGWTENKCTRESKKLSALLFFQFIYTKVGVEKVRHFSS